MGINQVCARAKSDLNYHSVSIVEVKARYETKAGPCERMTQEAGVDSGNKNWPSIRNNTGIRPGINTDIYQNSCHMPRAPLSGKQEAVWASYRAWRSSMSKTVFPQGTPDSRRGGKFETRPGTGRDRGLEFSFPYEPLSPQGIQIRLPWQERNSPGPGLACTTTPTTKPPHGQLSHH